MIYSIYTNSNQNACCSLRTILFYFLFLASIVGMLLISSLAVTLMILSVSSFALKIPKTNKTQSEPNVFSNGITMHSAAVQSNVRPLKPSNHKEVIMPQMSTTSMQHETFRPLERLEAQPNYHNPRNTKGKMMLPVWRSARLPATNNFERFPTDYSSFSNQIPRPPRLTRTQSENHRRYIESVSEQPRPFNFPLEGPQPSEFRKTKSSKKENLLNKSKSVNNIQDILRQDQGLNMNQYRMPVGIHISGSFKNLQKSGISDVFRRYVQVQPQLAPSMLNYQRVAFDPFFPYKPKSLNEINSLAMKQLNLNRTKKKNKKNLLPSLIFQQSGQRPVAADYYMDALRMNNSLNNLRVQQNLKNEPFSLKLEVYPIRSGKKLPVLPLPGAHFLTTVRPSVQMFDQFYPQYTTPYGMPIGSNANYFNYVNPTAQLIKGRIPQSSSAFVNPYLRDKHPSESSPRPEDASKSNEKVPKSSANQLMVHLNVFPNKKENPTPQNHLYDVIHADVHDRSLPGYSPTKNETFNSTYIDCETGEKVFDDEVDGFEPFDYQHNNNAKSTFRKSENLVDRVSEQKTDETLSAKRSVASEDSVNGAKMSTFRFPVENLMQFQANDAVM